jgi:hypothetical protein
MFYFASKILPAQNVKNKNTKGIFFPKKILEKMIKFGQKIGSFCHICNLILVL